MDPFSAIEELSLTFITGAYAILDPHNYMRYNNPSQQPATGSVIGNTSDPNAATTIDFELFWYELASRFKDNEKVIFGIMNEVHPSPHLIPDLFMYLTVLAP